MKQKKRSTSYSKGTALTYEGILDAIHGACEAMEQWSSLRHYDFALHHASRAEALVELLEVHLTGNAGASHGGYDLEHTDGRAPVVNNKLVSKMDFATRLQVLIKELDFRRLISSDFKPNASTTPA